MNNFCFQVAEHSLIGCGSLGCCAFSFFKSLLAAYLLMIKRETVLSHLKQGHLTEILCFTLN